MKSGKTAFFCEIFSFGLFFSVLFLLFFRNLYSSLDGIELFIPVFAIPVFCLIAFFSSVILIPRNFKFSLNYDAIFNMTAMLFSVFGLVFLFLSFFLLKKYFLELFFIPGSSLVSMVIPGTFVLACGYMTGILCGISLKKIKTPEEYETAFNGFFGGIAAGCFLLLILLFLRPEWMIFLPSFTGFLFLLICFIAESKKFLQFAAFFLLLLIFGFSSLVFIFFNSREFFSPSVESPFGKYESNSSGICFNGRFEPFKPELDQIFILAAGLQNQKSGKKILIVSNANIGTIYSSVMMPFIEKTDILSFSSAFSGLLHPMYSDGVRISEDPLAFLKRKEKRYDLIFLCDTNYASLASQRFFSLKMFRAVRENLNRDGILAVKLPSPVMKNENVDRILTSTVFKVFPHVLLIDGKNRFLLASEQELDLSPELLDKHMNLFFAGKNIRLPKNLFTVIGPWMKNSSIVIDGKKTDSKNIMMEETPLLSYETWKQVPFLEQSFFSTEIYRFISRHLTVILLITAVLYLLIRYFMTNHLERKMLFRSLELGMFTFGTFAFFCVLYQLRIGRLYSMITLSAGFFALGILGRKWIFGRKIRGTRGYVFLSGLLPFAVCWIYPESIHLTEWVLFAGMFFLGVFFRNELDLYSGKCTDIRWTLFLPGAVMFGGVAGVLLFCLIQPCYGMLSCMIFLFLLRFPGMIRRS